MDITKHDIDLDAEYALRGMLFAEEIGSHFALDAQIRRNGWKLLRTNDKDLTEQYQQLIKRFTIAKTYEEQYGQGSLLRLNHPAVQRLIDHGLIRESEIAAAVARESCTIKGALQENCRYNGALHTLVRPAQN